MSDKRIEYHRIYQDTAYLKLVQTILNEGFTVRNERTGVGTIGINGYEAKYDMSRHARYLENGDLEVDNFPLLTTKKVFLKGIIHELLWLMRGETNIKYLVDNDVNIWNDWPLKAYNQQYAILRTVPPISRSGSQQANMEDFIDAIRYQPGFAEVYGELGPVYGKQWRKWDAGIDFNAGPEDSHVAKHEHRIWEYLPNSEGYHMEGIAIGARRYIDQLADMVSLLKTDPYSRRNIVTAWNPADIEEMTKSGLPPCHMQFQALVRPNPEDEDRPYLDLVMYQRSADCFLGVPFNVASYSMLLILLAKEVGFMPGTLIHNMGSAHIYLNHIDQIKEQLSREPVRSPTLTISPNSSEANCRTVLETEKNSVSAYEISDFVLTNYKPYGAIKGSVAV